MIMIIYTASFIKGLVIYHDYMLLVSNTRKTLLTNLRIEDM